MRVLRTWRLPAPAVTAVLSVCVALAAGLLQPAASAARILPDEDTWRADVRKAMDGSRAYLVRRAERGGGRLAVNLDIDNTALASHYDPGVASTPVLRFARRAHQLDLDVIFNTARHRGDGNLRHAARALRRAGYPVTHICGRHRDEQAVDSKQRCRRESRAMGYTLVANVGNRRTDFAGPGYERAFRLPSYGGRLS